MDQVVLEHNQELHDNQESLRQANRLVQRFEDELSSRNQASQASQKGKADLGSSKSLVWASAAEI